jgi:hypothetical protein
LLPVGDNKYYSLKFFVFLFSILDEMVTRSEILGFLTENKTLFHDQYHVVKLGLFGSYAREMADEQSDIDILIELAPGTQNIYELKKDLKNFIRNKFNKEVDICREKTIKPVFRDLINREAVYV